MHTVIPLHQLLAADYPPKHMVCWHPRKTWAELQGMAAGIVSQLSEPTGKPWLLALDSAFQFAAALMACWQRGITPIIAPPVLGSPTPAPRSSYQLKSFS